MDTKRPTYQNTVLIYGPARSGTSWLSQVLGSTTIPIRFYNEPFFHMPHSSITTTLPEPEGTYALRKDHTALPYTPDLEKDHWLLRSFNSLHETDPDFKFSFRKHLPKVVLRNDKAPKVTLIKEVHSLLALEGILKSLKCKTIVITRNPLYAVDSLLSFRTLAAHMWRKEANFVTSKKFLDRFNISQRNKILAFYLTNVDDGISRKGVLFSKVLTVALLNQMLTQLAIENENVCHIRYETLCENPIDNFKRLGAFVGIITDQPMINFIEQLAESSTQDDGPYSLQKNAKTQIRKPLKFITTDEMNELESILKELIPENKLVQPLRVLSI